MKKKGDDCLFCEGHCDEWICAGLNKDKYAVLVSSNDSGVCFCPLCQISHLEDVVTRPRKRAQASRVM